MVEELEGVLAGAGPGVSDSMGLLEMAVSPLSNDQRDVVGGLEGRLVEAGKGAARVGGFKLRDGVVAAGGFGEIEAAQLVVEDAGEGDVKRGLACGEFLREGEGGLLLFLVERDGGGLLFAGGGDGDALEGDLCGVESDGVERTGGGDVDGFDAGEGGLVEVGREGEGVVVRADGLREPLCAGVTNRGRQKTQQGSQYRGRCVFPGNITNRFH